MNSAAKNMAGAWRGILAALAVMLALTLFCCVLMLVL